MMRKAIRKLINPKESFKNPVLNSDCTEFEVNNWILSEFILEKIIPLAGIHPYPLNELMLITGAMCRLAPDQLFEWGTHLGISARIFYETGKTFNIKTIIHTIDLPPDMQHVEHPGQKHARFIKHLPEVKIHRGDGLETALMLATKLPPDTKIMFFVDGDHRYESVFRELSGIIDHFPKANILLHDTFHQSEASGYNIGPYRAIQDVLSKTNILFKIIQSQGGLPGMTLLYH
jgi:cephalosporin hydroxylase